jgi:MoaA/NifB/PqqE/SkfB family radical SAM enzyme
MSDAAYSALKAAWHTKEIETLRSKHHIVPRQVQLIISDLCNHDCHFCSYRMSAGLSSEQFGEDTGKGFTMNPNRKIPTEKAMEIIRDCADMGVGAVQFTGGGEPTVHADHLEIFKFAQDLGLETSLVTNGAILKDGWEDVFAKMAWIRVSIDAGNPWTYSKVRRIPEQQYNKTLDNLERIVANAPDSCLVGAGYCVTRENYKDIFQGCLDLKHTGVPYVRVCAMFSTDGAGYYEGIYDEIKLHIAEAKGLEDGEFSVVDLFGDRISDLVQHAPDYEFCGYQQFNVYIGANLKVYRCCTTSYTKHGEVGDLSDMRFIDWHRYPARRLDYALFDARTCQVCQFNRQNRVINYLMEPRPLHVDFV